MPLPKKYNFNDYDNYLTEPNYTTSAEAQDYFRNMDMLVGALVDAFLWQPETNYKNGDVIKSPSMPNGVEAVCVAENGGKSSNVEPQWGNVGGENIADGTCFWKLRMQGTVTSVNGAKPNVNGEVTVPTMQGATSTTNGASGLVPAPSAGDNEKFLCGDGTFKKVEGVPTGFIAPYGGNDIPTGWLACNGATVSRTTYAKLFAAIGTTYGAGDGSTTFNLPNMNNGSFAEGSDTVGTVKSAGLPQVKLSNKEQLTMENKVQEPKSAVLQTVKSGNYSMYAPTNGFSYVYPTGLNVNNNHVIGTLAVDLIAQNSIYGKSDTVQPKAVTVKYCIKY